MSELFDALARALATRYRLVEVTFFDEFAEPRDKRWGIERRFALWPFWFLFSANNLDPTWFATRADAWEYGERLRRGQRPWSRVRIKTEDMP